MRKGQPGTKALTTGSRFGLRTWNERQKKRRIENVPDGKISQFHALEKLGIGDVLCSSETSIGQF